jgi:hypothetical protein
MAAMTTIAEDLSCAACGYNLRGLRSDSVCPECGVSIQASVKAIPITDWLPRFRLGVTFLLMALLVAPAVESVIWSRACWSLNRDGLVYLDNAALFLPAVWLLTRRAPFLVRDPHRLRGLLVSLTVFQLVLAGLAIILLNHFNGYWGSVALLSAYTVGPLVFAIVLWMMLGLLNDPLPIIPRAPAKVVVQCVRSALCFSLLGPAIDGAVISFARVGQIGAAPTGDTWIANPWNDFLNTWFSEPGILLRQPAWLACMAVVIYYRFRLQSRNVGLGRSIAE